MRLFAAFLAGLAVAASGAAAAVMAHAEPAARAIIVLDRGAEAKAGSASDAGNALRLWKTLVAHGVDTQLLAAGVGSDGLTRIARVAPTSAALAALETDPVFAFRGATDARAVLAHVLDGDGTGAVDVILLGPWSTVPVEKAKAYAGALKRWNQKAPKAARILSIGKGAGREVLAPARGWAGDGRVVIGFGAPGIETSAYSPLPRGAEPVARLAARARLLCDVLWMGAPPEASEAAASAVLTLTSAVAADTVTAEVNAGLHTWRIQRRVEDGRQATLTFRRTQAEEVHWLSAPPAALTFRWDKLQADARLVGPEGEAAPVFTALDAAAGKPVALTLRLQRTLSGRTPAWKVGVAEGALPSGLAVHVGDEVRTSPEVAESKVRVTFAAQAGAPLEAEGVITLTADGMPAALRLPYEVRVQPGRARWEVVAAPVALPPAAADTRTRITITAANANVPETLTLVASCDGGQEGWLRAQVHAPDGAVVTWRLGAALPLRVGVEHTLAFSLEKGAPGHLDWPCKVTLALKPLPGVELDAEPALVTVRQRRPRLVLQRAPVEHRLAGPTLLAEEPAVLTLDADGGDGDWLVALLQTTPVVRVGGDAPIGWQAVPRGAGVWHIVPAGRWTGSEPGVFADEELQIGVAFEWPPGDVPVATKIPVRIPARWGKKGFLLLGLAGLALVLALTVLGWMRTPPVTGTLLYTVDGLTGTVGRLDLAPVKRRVHAITSGTNGRLAIAAEGKVVARVRPTRVGGMLEYTDSEGARERRLLVDGMSLRIGRHLVRYVSGLAAEVSDAEAPREVEDLLGPEFDIESGRIAGSSDTRGDDAPPTS